MKEFTCPVDVYGGQQLLTSKCHCLLSKCESVYMPCMLFDIFTLCTFLSKTSADDEDGEETEVGDGDYPTQKMWIARMVTKP